VSAAGDALVLLSLATTVFFSVPVGEARSRVALYLVVTMLPFSVMAPVIGPLLDRFRHGRRYALAVTLVSRAFLAWVMAGAVAGGQEAFALYPAAFGHLVASKAYGVTRAAATPRVLPPALSLVTANSRVLLGGIAAVTVATPIGAGLMRLTGPEWSLRLAFVVFVVGTALALALPARVDSAAGERAARLTTTRGPVLDGPELDRPGGYGTADAASAPGPDGVRPDAAAGSRYRRGRRSRWGIGPRVVLGLRGTAALRWLTGFLTFFLAFALRTEPLSDRVPPLGVIGLVVTAAGIGSTIGTSLGAALRRLTPEVVVTAVLLLAAAGAALGALAYSLVTVLVTGLCAGLAASLGKLALDALVQREVPEEVRTSAFARSETVLQLAWVVGGGVGIALPVAGRWGLALAAGLLLAVLVLTARQAWAGRRPATP
jgi:MFS family permease